MYQKRAFLFTSLQKISAICYNFRTFHTDIDETDNSKLLSRKVFIPYISSSYTLDNFSATSLDLN